jgi:DNA polymerase-1
MTIYNQKWYTTFMPKKQEKLAIIDGHALIHRAWHAIPPTLTNKSGEMLNAVYGFTAILLKVMKDLKPDYIAVAFDLPKPTFRHEQYDGYKAHREKQADELYAQIPRIREVVAAFNIPIYEQAGFEADDVIATIVKLPEVEKIQSIIVTGDMDTLQLVDKNTIVYTANKGIADTIIYDIEGVKKRFDGLTPDNIVDYKALRGDPSDNIPGVRGIGEKGAISLLKDFTTIENLYTNIDSPKISERYKKLLLESKDNAFLSKQLCQMVHNVPIDFSLKNTKATDYDPKKVFELFQELEFKSLISKLPKSEELQAETEEKTESVKTFTGVDYQLIDDEKAFENFFKKLSTQKQFVFDTETTGLNPYESELLGISFCWQEKQAYYVTAEKTRLEKLKPIFADAKIQKAGHNMKFDIEVLVANGITVDGVWLDTMIASYLINPGSRQHSLDNLAFSELGYQMQPITELIGSGKSQISLKEVPLNQVSDYSCEDADITFRLINPLLKELKKNNNLDLLNNIEMPLILVLATMEAAGILIDTDLLKKLSKEVGADLIKAEKAIYKLAGREFNVASPLQLKVILFEELGIPVHGLGRTKTGVSTAAGELEKLKGQHPIIEHILKFRELAKLKSTYLDALPKLVDKTGRIHTSYNQTIAATGRLSSTDPNLQNIPIRTELGAQIRKAFVAPKDFVILSADYSQIELRIVASLADDKKMIESFQKKEDIHARTAAEINNVPLEKVTKEMRYAAKAVNFGIIYGQGPWGLAESAGITRAEASDFIKRYFEIYQPIKKYLEHSKELASKNGFVETFFGRRRYLPEINASMQQVRAAAERAAINHPVQGTAADLLKLAMIKVHQELPSVSPNSKMLLQVHDELVFEVPKADADKVAQFVIKKMEEVYTLKAPVETNVSVGTNWGELKRLF